MSKKIARRVLLAICLVLVSASGFWLVILHGRAGGFSPPPQDANPMPSEGPQSAQATVSSTLTTAPSIVSSIPQTAPATRLDADAHRLAPLSIHELLAIVTNTLKSASERSLAVAELGNRKAAEAFPVLTALVKDADVPLVLRYKCARSIGQLGNPEAMPVLGNLLSDHQQDRHLRIVSALALGTIGGAEAVAQLSRAASDDDTLIRFKVIQAVDQAQSGDAAAIVANGLTDKDPYVRARAIHALGRSRAVDAVPTINDILSAQPDDFTTVACLTALGFSGGDQARAILNKYLTSSNTVVRTSAEQAIQQIVNGGTQ